MQFWTLEEMDAAPAEIEPGVTIERRAVLRLALQSAGVAVFGSLAGCRVLKVARTVSDAVDEPSEDNGPEAPPEATTDPEVLTPGEFVHRVRPQARALVASPMPDEEAYLALSAGLLARMRPEPLWRPVRVQNGYGMGTVAYFPPVVLYEIRMEPDAVIHLHDHRHYNGVLRCLEGSVRCRNFDIVPPEGTTLDVAAGEVPPKGADFVIHETHDQVLAAGATSTLSRDRDNIHHVVAGADGARLVDLFTHFRPEARSYGLDWDEAPFDAQARLYRAAWK